MAEIATENKAPSSGKKLKVWLIVLAAVLIVGGVVLFSRSKATEMKLCAKASSVPEHFTLASPLRALIFRA